MKRKEEKSRKTIQEKVMSSSLLLTLPWHTISENVKDFFKSHSMWDAETQKTFLKLSQTSQMCNDDSDTRVNLLWTPHIWTKLQLTPVEFLIYEYCHDLDSFCLEWNQKMLDGCVYVEPSTNLPSQLIDMLKGLSSSVKSLCFSKDANFTTVIVAKSK